jgi:hypothetical protein
VIDRAATAKAIASADDRTAALVSRAAALSGKPLEHDAWLLATAAATITNNLRRLLATAERRTT